jgi:hypothetical protein
MVCAALILPAAAWAAGQQLRVSTSWSAFLAASAAAGPLLVAELRDRGTRNEQHDNDLTEHVRAWPPSQGDLLGDLTNPVELGVKPAAIGMGQSTGISLHMYDEIRMKN